MKKPKPCHTIISHGTYPFDIYFSLGETAETIKKNLSKKLKLTDEEKEAIDECSPEKDGRCLMLEGGQSIIYITKLEHDVLAHECLHAVQQLFDRIDVGYCEDTQEAWAYQLAYILREIYTFLDKR